MGCGEKRGDWGPFGGTCHICPTSIPWSLPVVRQREEGVASCDAPHFHSTCRHACFTLQLRGQAEGRQRAEPAPTSPSSQPLALPALLPCATQPPLPGAALASPLQPPQRPGATQEEAGRVVQLSSARTYPCIERPGRRRGGQRLVFPLASLSCYCPSKPTLTM